MVRPWAAEVSSGEVCLFWQVRKLELEEGAFAYEVHAKLPGIGVEGIKCAAFPPSSHDTTNKQACA
jgi:hypothetical protein